MQAASKTLYECMSEVYEPDWTGHDLLTVQSQNIEMLWQDLGHKMTDQVLIPLNTYQGQFPEMRVSRRPFRIQPNVTFLIFPHFGNRKRLKREGGSWWTTTDSDTVSRPCRAPRSERKSRSAGPRSNWRRPNGRLPFSTRNSTRSCRRSTTRVCHFSSPTCRLSSRPSRSSTLSSQRSTASWSPSSTNWPRSRADGRRRATTGAARRPRRCSRHPAAIRSTAQKTVNSALDFLNAIHLSLPCQSTN